MGTSTSYYRPITAVILTSWLFTYHIVYIAYIYPSPLACPSLPLTQNYKYKSKSLSKFLSEYRSPSTSIECSTSAKMGIEMGVRTDRHEQKYLNINKIHDAKLLGYSPGPNSA
jgi:hypothetical protein